MKYKTLIVSGCSFTYCMNMESAYNQGWPYVIAKLFDMQVINLAAPGAGNRHIQYSLLNYLAKNNVDPETTLIGIMWSHPWREDYFLELSPENYKNKSICHTKYDDYTFGIDGGRLMNSIVDDSGQFKLMPNFFKKLFEKEDLVINFNKAGKTTETWLAIESTISYLQNKGFNFFQTIFLDYYNKSDLLTNLVTNNRTDWNWENLANYSYLKELERLNLPLNKNNLLDFEHHEYLGEFSYLNNLLESDDFHPNYQAHNLWTTKILLRKLKKLGYI